MKKTLTLIVLCLVTGIVSAQAPDLKVEWAPVKKIKDVPVSYILESSNGHFFTVGRNNSKRIFIDDNDINVKIYKTGTLKESKNLVIEKFDFKGEKASYHSSLTLNGDLYIFYTVYVFKTKETVLIYKKVNSTGQVSQDEELMSMRPEKKSDGNMRIKTSEDRSKILVFGDHNEKNKRGVLVKILNDKLETLWEKETQLPFSAESFFVNSFTVSNAGEVFFLGFKGDLDSKEKRKNSNKPNEDYRLFKISENEDFVEMPLKIGRKYITDIEVFFNEVNDKVNLLAFYSNSDYKEFDRYLFMILNPDDITPVKTFEDKFNPELLKKFDATSRSMTGSKLIDYEIKSMETDENGNPVFICQQEYTVEPKESASVGGFTMGGNNIIDGMPGNYVNDILVLKFNNEKGYEWNAHIPKRGVAYQMGMFLPENIGYYLIRDGSKLNFIYSGQKKNLERIQEGDARDIKRIENDKNRVSILAVVDGSGNTEFSQLIDDYESKVFLVPNANNQEISDDKELIIFGSKGSNGRLGKISFQ